MDSTTTSIMEYEIAKLNKKVNKLESTIKRLQKENSILTSKVTNLEDIILKISSQMNINFQSSTSFAENDNNSHLPNKSSAIEETWLYYIPLDQKCDKEIIKKKLDIDEAENDLTFIELKADWTNDIDMISRLLKHFESFKEFINDFQSMSLDNLIEIFGQIFEISLMSDVIVVIRNIPTSKEKKKHELILASIAKMAGLMYKSYSTVLSTNETVGRMALVLESKEELGVINVNKDESRILLSVEKL